MGSELGEVLALGRHAQAGAGEEEGSPEGDKLHVTANIVNMHMIMEHFKLTASKDLFAVASMKRLAPLVNSVLAPECRHDGATGRKRSKGEGDNTETMGRGFCGCGWKINISQWFTSNELESHHMVGYSTVDAQSLMCLFVCLHMLADKVFACFLQVHVRRWQNRGGMDKS